MSLVYMIWCNSEMTWFILDNLADVFMNADYAFNDKLTYTKKLTHCCHRFRSQQMLELQVIVILRYFWIDMYSAHIFVSRTSSMFALMSWIYHCWSAESLKNCKLFLSQHNWEVNLNIEYYFEILNFFVSEMFLCNHSSDVISCCLNFNKHS